MWHLCLLLTLACVLLPSPHHPEELMDSVWMKRGCKIASPAAQLTLVQYVQKVQDKKSK